jgi:hypothetical protein
MSFINTVDIIGDEALTHSILNGSITEIADNRVTSVGDSAFRGCSALIKADFPSVSSIYNTAFHDCSSLVTLALRSETMCVLYYINSFDGSPIANGTGYIYVPGALYNSYLADSKWSSYANQFRVLENYTVDGTITGELDTNRFRVRFFNGDTLLQESYVHYGEMPVYTGAEPTPEEDYAFVGWSPAISVVTADVDYVAQFKYSKSVTRAFVNRTIKTYSSDTLTSLVRYAFNSCKELISVNLPNVTSTDEYVFNSCSKLASVDLSNVTSIGGFTFNNCSALISVNMSNVISIGSGAFMSCSKLTSVDLPNVTSIDSSAFSYCSALISVRLPATPPTLASTSDFNKVPTTCKFYIPTGSLSAYQSATNWSSLTSTYSFVEENR